MCKRICLQLAMRLGALGIGVVLAWLSGAGYFEVFGEYPVKGEGWFFCFAIAAVVAYASVLKGFVKVHTACDLVVMLAIGSAGAFTAFTEILPGRDRLDFDPMAPLPWFVVAVAYAAISASIRERRAVDR